MNLAGRAEAEQCSGGCWLGGGGAIAGRRGLRAGGGDLLIRSGSDGESAASMNRFKVSKFRHAEAKAAPKEVLTCACSGVALLLLLQSELFRRLAARGLHLLPPAASWGWWVVG